MIKAIVFLAIGAGAMFLYLNPGDVDGLVSTAKTAAHDSAVWVQEKTK